MRITTNDTAPGPVLAISGSLRARSSNTSALQAAAELAKPELAVELYAGLANLPAFNPDLDGDEPPAVVRVLRRRIECCRGLLISTPEYAHGIPGVLKNALDWLVGSVEFAGTPVALIHCSPRSTHVLPQLREVLTTMSADIVERASITLDLSGGGGLFDSAGIVADPALSVPLRAALTAFAAAIRARTADSL